MAFPRNLAQPLSIYIHAAGSSFVISPLQDRELEMEEPWKRLEGKVVMVTGASSGLGRELCLDLAKAGCRIVAAARRAHLLLSLCNTINSSPVAAGAIHAAAVELDVSAKESSLEAPVRRAWDAFGRIDVLVNNAGIRGGVYSSLQWPEDELNKIISTNQIGLWLLSKHVCRLMSDARLKGCVINISSISSLRPSHGDLPYSSSKQALNTISMGGNFEAILKLSFGFAVHSAILFIIASVLGFIAEIVSLPDLMESGIDNVIQKSDLSKSFAEIISGRKKNAIFIGGNSIFSPFLVSFSNLEGGSKSNGDSIGIKEPTIINGVPGIYLSDEELSLLDKPFDSTLIGKFSYRHAKWSDLIKYFSNL